MRVGNWSRLGQPGRMAEEMTSEYVPWKDFYEYSNRNGAEHGELAKGLARLDDRVKMLMWVVGGVGTAILAMLGVLLNAVIALARAV